MGAIVSGIGQMQSDGFQQNLSRLNQGLAMAQAGDATQRGGNQAALALVRGGQVAGQQKTGYAASGVDVGSGTPMQAMLDTRVMSSIDATTLRNNAAREAWGYKMQGLQYGMRADILGQKQKWDAISSFIGGAADLVSMGGNAGGAGTATGGFNTGSVGMGDFGGGSGTAYG